MSAVVIGATQLALSRQIVDEINVFLSMFVVIPLWVLVVGICYRCPQCGSLPMASESGLGGTVVGSRSYLDLSPTECRKCGAKLK